MSKKSAYFVLTVIVALTALFLARQRTLNILRADNGSLRKQVGLPTSARMSAVPEPPANPAPGLSGADEKELLQLRSKILPLREQLRDASNRVVVLTRSPKDAGSSSQPAFSETMTSFLNSETYLNAKRLAKALSRYSREHGSKLPDPDNFAAAMQEFYPDLPAAFTQRFELMREDTAPEKTRDESLIARERSSEPWPDGGWIRIYLTANGNADVIGPYQEEDWANWESEYAKGLNAQPKN
jgi:hypothetical protein